MGANYTTPRIELTPEEETFIRSNYATKSVDEMVAELKVSKTKYHKWKRGLDLPDVNELNKPEKEHPSYYFSWSRAKVQDFIIDKC